MKQRVCLVGFFTAMVAFAASIVACSSDSVQNAGSSLETENSIALGVKLADGTPAARSKVLVRPDDYLAGIKGTENDSEGEVRDSASGIYNSETDDQGNLNVPRLKPGRYVVEVRGDMDKGFERFSITDSTCDTLSVALAAAGSMSGQVVMPTGVSSVKVGIRGLDYVVQTDSLGNFEFESLPAGVFNAVGFIHSSYEYVDEYGEAGVYESFQALGVAPVEIKSGETVEGIVIGKQEQAQNQDTAQIAVKDTIPYIIYDFEDSTYGWYSSQSQNYASAKLSTVEGGGKYGLVAHLECHKDSMFNVWTMMGRNFSDYHDFTDLDSVVLWARGENPNGDSMWVSVSFDVHAYTAADSALGYVSGKAWAHVPLNSDGEWTKVKVTPDDLVPADSNHIGGNLGWDAVKDHVNSFGIFVGNMGTGDYELWVDDVEIYGIRGLYE